MSKAEPKVVSFHYILTGENGETLDSSRERGKPMSFLEGAGNIIPGLEKAISGRAAGDQFSVTVPPEEAYGQRQEGHVQRIPKKRLGNLGAVRPGQILSLHTQQGPVQVTVLKVGRFNLDVDANHPLAGRALTFEVEITDIREATEEEREHGHAH